MPEPKFVEVKRSLACKLAERGIVLSSRKIKDVAAIFAEQMRRNALTLDDLDRYVLDYADPTGETAVKAAMGVGA